MPSVRDLARLSDHVYHPDRPADHGWSLREPFGGARGFAAAAYAAPDGRSFALAFRGSDDPVDFLRDDAAIALRLNPEQTREARRAVARARVLAGGRPLYLTGHSLGGALAALMAAEARDLTAVTFNAPAVAGLALRPVDLLRPAFTTLLNALLNAPLVVAVGDPGGRSVHVRTAFDPVSLSPTPGGTRNLGRTITLPVPEGACPSPPFPRLGRGDGVGLLVCNHQMRTVLTAIEALPNLPELHHDLTPLLAAPGLLPPGPRGDP